MELTPIQLHALYIIWWSMINMDYEGDEPLKCIPNSNSPDRERLINELRRSEDQQGLSADECMQIWDEELSTLDLKVVLATWFLSVDGDELVLTVRDAIKIEREGYRVQVWRGLDKILVVGVKS